MKRILTFKKFLLESVDDEIFYVLINHSGKNTIISVSKMEGKWYEKKEFGEPIAGIGRTHVGSNPENIIKNIQGRYDSAKIISEDEALELA